MFRAIIDELARKLNTGKGIGNKSKGIALNENDWREDLRLMPEEWRQMYLLRWGISDLKKIVHWCIGFAVAFYFGAHIWGDTEARETAIFIAILMAILVIVALPLIALYVWQHSVWQEVLRARYNGTTPRHTPILTHTAYMPD